MFSKGEEGEQPSAFHKYTADRLVSFNTIISIDIYDITFMNIYSGIPVPLRLINVQRRFTGNKKSTNMKRNTESTTLLLNITK